MEAVDIEKVPMNDSMKTLGETYQAVMRHSGIDEHQIPINSFSNCFIAGRDFGTSVTFFPQYVGVHLYVCICIQLILLFQLDIGCVSVPL
jgi:hypothetical protein